VSEELKPEGQAEPQAPRKEGEAPPDAGEAQGEPGSGSKWGFIIVGVLILALMVAVYLNKVVYNSREKEALKVDSAEKAPPASQGEAAKAPPAAPTQEISEADAYRHAVIQARAVSAQSIFQEGDKSYIVASLSEVGQQGSGPMAQIVHMFGKLFDATKLAKGVDMLSIYRRGLFTEGQMGMMYCDALPVLGQSDKLMPAIGVVAAATKLVDDEPVIGLQVGNEARAYPVRFMNYHEIVNDTLGNTPIVVVWNSVANAPAAMDRRIDGKELRFGTAGLAYQSAIALYDTETRSLWTPITAKGLTGVYADRTLTPLQTVWTTWSAWRKAHPDTTVMLGSKPEIPQIDYGKNPQTPTADYRTNNQLVYPVEGFVVADTPLSPKEMIYGIAVDGQYRAYPEATLGEKHQVKDALGGKEITLTFDAAGGFPTAKDAQGNPVLCQRMYWLVWRGYHPTSDVYGVIAKPAAETAPAASGASIPPGGTSAPQAPPPY